MKVKSADDLIRLISTSFNSDAESAICQDGVIGSARWIWYSPGCDGGASGELHLADAAHFDRWANSRTIILKIQHMGWEHLDWESITRRALSLFDK